MAALFLGLGIVLLGLYVCRKYYALRARLPPGPVGIPLIGNLHQAPSKYPWRTYAEWRKKYGPVFSLKYGPTTLVVIGTHEVAHQLLEKRSNIYSSRPRACMVHECISKGYRTLNLPYGQRWRVHHRLQASLLNIRMSQLYRDLQDLESKQLVFDFLTHTDFAERFHRYSASLIFGLAYGRRTPRGDEPEVQTVDKIMHVLNNALLKTWIVDIYPVLNNLPELFAPWKRYADRMHEFEREFFTDILDDAESKHTWNWAKQVHTVKESKNLSRVEIAYIIGVLFEAGSDTTTMVLEVFVLAAVLHPEAVQKAQEELDRVVGTDRLPCFSDAENLPYVNAFIKEVIRWRPIIPGGVPHAVTEDDEYRGHHIPKNAVIMVNLWGMCMDPDVYEDPERFRPYRWIENPDLPLAAFGFGRRKCIGEGTFLFTSSTLLIILAHHFLSFTKFELMPLSFACRPTRRKQQPLNQHIQASLGIRHRTRVLRARRAKIQA